MRLSLIFELLLIFLLIAFAAYARVIDNNARAATKVKGISGPAPVSLKQATESVNKYCVCNEKICNCCRDFHIPLVQLAGPGCASLEYIAEDKLAMQLSIGDNILSTSTVNGKNPKPVCVNLPGGFSKFCGKIYSIRREADKHFKACLGLELKSGTEVEASLRVSCFRFGPDGLKLRPAEPLPAVVTESSAAADDDYDDLFGLDEDDDEEDEDEDDDEKISPDTNAVVDPAVNESDQDADEDDDDPLGFGALLDIFSSDDDSTTDKKTKTTTAAPLPSYTIPILALTSTAKPISDAASDLTLSSADDVNPENSESDTASVSTVNLSNFQSDKKNKSSEASPISQAELDTIYHNTENIMSSPTTKKQAIESTTSAANDATTAKSTEVTKPNKIVKGAEKDKHKNTNVNKKKINVTPQSVNKNKIKLEETPQTTTQKDTDDDEYDYSQIDENSDEIQDSDEHKIIEEDEKEESEENDKSENADKVEDDEEYSEEDEDDEEEEAVLAALAQDEKRKNSSVKKYSSADKTTNKSVESKEESDYEIEDLLARKQRSARTHKMTK